MSIKSLQEVATGMQYLLKDLQARLAYNELESDASATGAFERLQVEVELILKRGRKLAAEATEDHPTVEEGQTEAEINEYQETPQVSTDEPKVPMVEIERHNIEQTVGLLQSISLDITQLNNRVINISQALALALR